MNPSLYERLGLDSSASSADIRIAYRKLVKTVHPDNGGDEDDYIALKHAHDVLMDPERRAHYDATGEEGSAGSEADIGARARQFIIQQFRECIVNPHWDPAHMDLLKHIQDQADHELRERARTLAEAQKIKVRLELTLTRLKRRTEGEEDLFRGVTAAAMKDIDADILRLELNTKIFIKVREILAAYSYAVEEAPKRQDHHPMFEEDMMEEFFLNMRARSRRR